MAKANKAALLARRRETTSGFREEEVEVPGMGTITVRGLSRHEVLYLQRAKGAAQIEALTVHLGCIDPAFTEDEVKQWQRVSEAGELDIVTRKIGELSGMFDRPDKKAYQEFEVDPGSEFRVLPSGEAVDDGEPSSDGDE